MYNILILWDNSQIIVGNNEHRLLVLREFLLCIYQVLFALSRFSQKASAESLTLLQRNGSSGTLKYSKNVVGAKKFAVFFAKSRRKVNS